MNLQTIGTNYSQNITHYELLNVILHKNEYDDKNVTSKLLKYKYNFNGFYTRRYLMIFFSYLVFCYIMCFNI